MSTNAERITALDSLRRREPSWMRSQKTSGFEGLGFAVLIASGFALGLMIAIGLWNAAHKTTIDDYTRQTVAGCQAQGYVATIERSQSGAVLGVRCNAVKESRQ